MEKNSGLNYIDISGNGIQDKRGIAIASALKVNQSLKHINIYDTTIGAEGTCQLVACAGSGLKIELSSRHKSAAKLHHRISTNVTW